MTMTIEKHTDVRTSVDDAYARWWHSFESASLGEDLETVQREGGQRYRWRASVAGLDEEWITEVTERIPGRRIAWTSREGAPHAGCVTFHRLDDGLSRVMLQIEYRPQGLIEKLGAWLGVVDRRVEAALEDFKRHLESDDAGAERREQGTRPAA